ncbi:MAG: glycosyltransferase family 4 protein [Conexivisphaerales archaeon]
MNLADKIGVNSRFTSRLLPSISSQNIFVLYPGVYADSIEYKKVNGGKKTILFVGRLIERKGVDILLRAFSQIVKEFPDLKLVIVGDGPEYFKLKQLCQELKIIEKVEFTGELRGKELTKRYAEASIFVLPSRKIPDDIEGFGTVFLEAAAFAVPSISTFTGGIPEAIINGVTGLLVPSDDSENLAKAMMTLLRNDVLRIRMGEEARNRVLNNFLWRHSASVLVSNLVDTELQKVDSKFISLDSKT